MKIIITKKQYKNLMFSLIDTITGGDLSIDDEPDGYYDVIDFFGNEVMSIFYSKKSGRSRGCKNDLSLTGYFVRDLEKYVPYYKHKMFSKVLVDYVYEKTNIKCDCVDYFYFEGNDTYSDNKRFVYNLKKKKRINESQYNFLLESKSEKLKELLKDKFNFDLTNNVYLIETPSDIPFGYDKVFPKFVLSKILKNHGTAYLFSIYNEDLHGDYLFYDIHKDPTIVDERGWHYDEDEFIEKIGLSYIGMTLIEILNLYLYN